MAVATKDPVSGVQKKGSGVQEKGSQRPGKRCTPFVFFQSQPKAPLAQIASTRLKNKKHQSSQKLKQNFKFRGIIKLRM